MQSKSLQLNLKVVSVRKEQQTMKENASVTEETAAAVD